MQSAFVDIGLDRDAFLYVSDFFEDNEEYDKIVSSVEEKVLRLEKGVAAAPAAAPAVAAEAETPRPVEAALVQQPAVVPPPQASVAAPDPRQPRGDRDRGGDRDRNDRDRDGRGRRSRRRRPPKGGGRGLPDSKFFSPGREPEPRVAEERAEEPRMAAAVEEADDFFVLPGESLAKYSHEEREAQPDAPSDFVDAEPAESEEQAG